MTIDASLLVPHTPSTTPEPGAAVPTPTTMGQVYNFNNVGDVLATHQHGPNDTHISVVLSGSLTLTDDGISRTVVAGDVVDLGVEPHSFIALEPSQIFNVIKSGISKESLGKYTSEINYTISHLYNRVNNLNDTMTMQVASDTDLSNNITMLYNKISDLKTLINIQS